MLSRLLAFAFLFLTGLPLLAQSDGDDDKGWGLELGVRNTFSVFGDESLSPGFGGQFRIRPSDRLNTEWYLDYIKSDIDGLGSRRTLHIGWSVMFYPWKVPEEQLIEPYLLAGHCFDHAKVNPVQVSPEIDPATQERWSSALQLGIGSHFRVSERADFSLSAQYMTHLGNELDVEKKEQNGRQYIEPVQKKKELSLEGHLLVTLSMNVKIIKR
ncbi:MAG: hypothetical protein ABEH43_07755 [Flavobacteriales bacterium]